MQSLYGAIANTNKKEIMAIGIDRVYQKVLAIANKEQRGYITPQEFNLFAEQAQLSIFEQYFYDLEQRQRGPGNSFDYADITSNIEEKISMFDIHDVNLGSTNATGLILFPVESDTGAHMLGDNVWRLGVVKVRYNDPSVIGSSADKSTFFEAEQIQQKELGLYMGSYLTSRFGGPYYTRSRNGSPALRIFPPAARGQVEISYVIKPSRPVWNYVIGGSQNALYNPASSVDFQLHDSEENELVTKILQLAGVTLKDPMLIQVAAQEEMKNIQQEKQ